MQVRTLLSQVETSETTRAATSIKNTNLNPNFISGFPTLRVVFKFQLEKLHIALDERLNLSF